MRASIGERRLEERDDAALPRAGNLACNEPRRPAEIPRLEGGSDSEEIIELAERDEMLGAGPPSEDLVVVGREIFARPLCQIDPGRAQPTATKMTARAPHETPARDRPFPLSKNSDRGERASVAVFIDSRDIQIAGLMWAVGGGADRRSSAPRAPLSHDGTMSAARNEDTPRQHGNFKPVPHGAGGSTP